jgi:hypothetical protein
VSTLPLRVVEYSSSDGPLWERFVDESLNGTVFHRPSFLAYHPPERFTFRHLMVYDAGALVAVLPGGVYNGEYRSPLGASFGGLCVGRTITLSLADAIVKALLDWCRGQGLAQIVVTPPMQVYGQSFDEVVEYALRYNGFVADGALFSSVIDLQQIRSKQDLSRNTRHKINKAINKGVRVEESTDLETFYPILLTNKAKFNARPTHTLEELQRLEALMPGMMKLFMAYYEGVAVAGELLFVANSRCVLNFYTMHLYEYHHLFAVNYLVEYALTWAAAQGYRYYDYGVSADTFSTNPLEPSWSLVTFKESMGARGCVRTTYRCAL